MRELGSFTEPIPGKYARNISIDEQGGLIEVRITSAEGSQMIRMSPLDFTRLLCRVGAVMERMSQ